MNVFKCDKSNRYMFWILLFMLVASVDARCRYLPIQQLVPYDLVNGLPGGLDDQGVFRAYAIFNWSHASPYYRYSIPELNMTLQREEDTTMLEVFTRPPETHAVRNVLENEETFFVTVEVASICAPEIIVTRATYFINLTATYDFSHNVTSNTTLVMHPDVHRELIYVAHINESHNISIYSSVNIIGGDDGMCAGINSTIGLPCYAVLNVSIVRTVTNIDDTRIEPLYLSYGLSQFTRTNCLLNNTFNSTLPEDFNVTRYDAVLHGIDRRFDMCEGIFTSDGNITETARDTSVQQAHAVVFHTINASCTYRLFVDECSASPFTYLVGWFDYDYIAPSLLGTPFFNFTL